MAFSSGRTADLARFRPRRETLLWGALLVNTEVLLLLGYAAFGSSSLLSLSDLRYWLYPFVWINVGLWAIVRADPPAASPRHRRAAAALAVGYFGVLAYFGGLVGASHGPNSFRLVLTSIPPGWAPALTYTGEFLSVTLIPFRLVGYGALAYLVYATALDAAGSAVTGLLGVLSCVSCSWPILVTLATGVAGSGTGVVAAVSTGAYGISTLVFVATVALLAYRPFAGSE